ncbi:hypothetical protein MYX76_02460 [Desulfobacterota bacterium AH_259_B03_O07]|nr:hypothetical protein [Desulfobacterota bacterium AH_259_B03_O07]
MPPKGRIRLSNMRDVRRLISRLISQLLNDELDPKTALTAGQLCALLLKTMDYTSIEDRLEMIERSLEMKSQSTPIKSDVISKIRELKSLSDSVGQ